MGNLIIIYIHGAEPFPAYSVGSLSQTRKQKIAVARGPAFRNPLFMVIVVYAYLKSVHISFLGKSSKF